MEEITRKQELLRQLCAAHSVADRLPDNIRCAVAPMYIQLFSPDEGEIKAAFGQDIMQRDSVDSKFDERFVTVDGVDLIWLVEKRGFHAQTP